MGCKYICLSTGKVLIERGGDALVAEDGSEIPLVEGIPCFLEEASLSSLQEESKAHYDETAWGQYDAAMDWQFSALKEDEESVRDEMLALLGVAEGDSVLEVGCGTGRDSWRIAQAVGESGEFYVQDLSLNMVMMCRERIRRDHSEFLGRTNFFVSDGGKLPFGDDTFDSVFHFGGFNMFRNMAEAAAEFARIVKPGGTVLLGDEGVAPWLAGSEFAAIVIENNPLFANKVPLEVLPPSAREVSVRWIMGNCFYLIRFTKGDGFPSLDLDLTHQGRRGGSMGTRYFGKLEGVTSEAKAMAIQAAADSGLSVHEWLDSVVRRAAKGQD